VDISSSRIAKFLAKVYLVLCPHAYLVLLKWRELQQILKKEKGNHQEEEDVCRYFIFMTFIRRIVTKLYSLRRERGLCRGAVSVCPSLSYCIKTSKHNPQTFSPSGSSNILVFPHEIWRYFHGITLMGHRLQVGYEKIATFNRYLALSWKRYKIGP